ncbi:2-hydroxyacid dehydrogenase [Acetobacter conturbans]|uniref:Glyoxylate/hydroxypyruvate reductase A n=1 Tax=Acetobacter conturbans TaxID=1737472 RepID=A0ABX0JY53_9PROT|nr:glyoxylate/hydroxypyruvate reductase A [Acetobacter conturbans]NHN88241.1 glyoxylate/hydroxypyruvate reductase A [Acetobacter conturbans]
MPKLVVSADGAAGWESWRESFEKIAPDIDVFSWFDPKADVPSAEYALVWEASAEELAQMEHLKGILCTGAGVNHLVQQAAFPVHVPLVRMGGDQTAVLMADYVIWAVISLLRNAKTWSLQQQKHLWHRNQSFRTSKEIRIGIMGFGNLGAAVGERLSKAGFSVSAWCRTARESGAVALFAGMEALPSFLQHVDILVNLLPSTSQTKHLIDAEFFAQLGEGAGFINVGRGDHVVEDDLLAALDSGILSGAILDVVELEPLPAVSPLWSHPKVTITPHVASEASRDAQVEYVANVIRGMERGEVPALLYRPERGY